MVKIDLCSRMRVFLCAFALMAPLSACMAVEGNQALVPQTVESYETTYTGEKRILVVGAFKNRSNYQQGIFSSGVDQMGNQAKTILKTHLQQTGRFTIVDRDHMESLGEEAAIGGIQQDLSGAQFAVVGDVVEFGRKETGDKQLFGLLGGGKKQSAYAKVALNIVDVRTSEIVYSAQGAGEYNLSSREIVGFGSGAGYDATLNGKVLNLAIREAVDRMVRNISSGAWVIN